MRFEITGTEGPSGRGISRVYEAPSEEAAQAMARRDGIAVGTIDLLLDMPGFASAPPAYVPPPPPAPMRPWRVEGADRMNGNAVVRQYLAQTDAHAAEFARNDGVHVIRITRADQPPPPPLDPYQAQFAAVTAPADPMPLEGDPRGYVPPDPRPDPGGWTSRASSSASATSTPRPHSDAAVSAADAHFEPLDPAMIAALATSPAVADPDPLTSLQPTATKPGGKLAPHAVEPEHPRLQAAATATFAFACAAYSIGGAALATALVAGIVALAQQHAPAGATARTVALVAIAIGAPTMFAAVVSHAISGACLGLREVVLRRRRKRDY